MRLWLGIVLLLCAGPALAAEPGFLTNGVTAHRGNSSEYPENTLAALESALELGVDWVEIDIVRTRDGQIVVSHDLTTGRVGDKDLRIPEVTYDELKGVDVATEFRQRRGQTRDTCPPAQIPLLEDVLRRVLRQERTRVSLQPKTDCVAEALALVRSLKGERWVGFNDGNLQYMAEVKRLAPEVPVFWDRGAETNIDEDIRTARQQGFAALVLHHSGVTPEKVRKIRAAGLEAGAWTVNDRAQMQRLLEMGVERIYTDHPRELLSLVATPAFHKVPCEGSYTHHLQGICVDAEAMYWSFTTTLVKTDREGQVLAQVPVANHHGDLCHHAGRLYVAVNLGKFNDPQGNADSWIYVYDARTLKELSRHAVPEVFHGAGGIGHRAGKFYVVGGLPTGVEENFVYEYDDQFRFVKRHVIASGHTHLGIQTATFAEGRWWFGCYGTPPILLVTDAEFRMLGRYEFDCSLGIETLPGGRLLVASGGRGPEKGHRGSVRVATPDREKGLRLSERER